MTQSYAAKLTGIEHYWAVIKEIGGTGAEFTIPEIAQQSKAHNDTVGDYVRRLVKGGYLAAAGWREVASSWRPTNISKARTYRLVRSAAAAPSLRRDGTPGLYGLGRQQMWNIIRGGQAAGGIDALTLQMLASTDQVPVSLNTCKDYLKKLEAAGYLFVLEPAANHRLSTYRLHRRMNTGPLAPVLMQAGTIVLDRNLNEVVGQPAVEELL